MYCPLESYDNEIDDWFSFAWMLQACVSHVEVHEQVKTVDDVPCRQIKIKYRYTYASHRGLMGSLLHSKVKVSCFCSLVWETDFKLQYSITRHWSPLDCTCAVQSCINWDKKHSFLQSYDNKNCLCIQSLPNVAYYSVLRVAFMSTATKNISEPHFYTGWHVSILHGYVHNGFL